MAEIKLVGVSKRFKRESKPFRREKGVERSPVIALDHLNLTIRDGEAVAVMGPSGCGKTTLLRVIAGLEPPDEGQVYFNDQDVTRVSPADRGVGMVFQSYALYPHMSSAENLAFYFRVRKRPVEIPDRVRETAKILGMGFEELLGRMPKGLSAGQRQRVAIGRCIVRDPSLFLFDEPLANLDAKLRSRTRTELKKLLVRFSISSVYVTHDQLEAIALGDRIAVMREGQIAQLGTYRELYERPTSAFVAGFLGTPTMNLFPGRIRDGRFFGAGFDLPATEAQGGLARDIPLLLGVRPEHIGLDQTSCVQAILDTSEVWLAERKQFLRVQLGDEEGTVLIDGVARLDRGDTVFLRFEPESYHLFEANTGQRLD